MESTKKGEYMIKHTRRKVVDLEALAKEIKYGPIHRAGIDVFPREQESNNDPWITPMQNLSNVTLTTH
ncbi:hypothetical protein ISU75_18850, partial [Leptospira borgpetersenii serovar Hardjo-bovis]|nr:hypothetical protein [Leptospira borgpetersenii serovar Hardjo-bovis]